MAKSTCTEMDQDTEILRHRLHRRHRPASRSRVLPLEVRGVDAAFAVFVRGNTMLYGQSAYLAMIRHPRIHTTSAAINGRRREAHLRHTRNRAQRIGDGPQRHASYKLRIVQARPATYRNCRIAGILSSQGGIVTPGRVTVKRAGCQPGLQRVNDCSMPELPEVETTA